VSKEKIQGSDTRYLDYTGIEQPRRPLYMPWCC